MKIKKLYVFLAIFSVLSCGWVLASSKKTFASAVSYNLNIGYLADGCRMTINGSVATSSLHVTQGYDVTITVANQSPYPIGSAYESLNNPYDGEKRSWSMGLGQSHDETYTNIQKSLSVTTTFGGGEFCGVGHGDTAYVYVDPPSSPDASPPDAGNTIPLTPGGAAAATMQTENSVPLPPPTDTSSGSVTVQKVTVAGSTVNANKPVEVNQQQPLVLHGQSTPNASVILTIHSTPKTVTVHTDSAGAWSYTVVGLALGDHYIDASVVDPATGVVSTPTKIMAFKVVRGPAAATVARNNRTLLMVGLVTLCVVVVSVLLAAQKKFKKPVFSKPKQTKKQVKRKK